MYKQFLSAVRDRAQYQGNHGGQDWYAIGPANGVYYLRPVAEDGSLGDTAAELVSTYGGAYRSICGEHRGETLSLACHSVLTNA